MLRAANFSGGVVAWRPDQMYGWPGLVRVRGDELLVAASERKHHVCPFGREVIIRSTDGGRTWGLPQEVYNSELDDRDSTLAALPDGTLLLAWFSSGEWGQPGFMRPEWSARWQRLTDRMREELAGDWLIRSTDGGHTWETAPRRMPHGGAEHIGPFTLTDGRLACFGYEIEGDRTEIYFYTSPDRGETWTRLGQVPCARRVPGNWPRPLAALVVPALTRGRTLSAPAINERALLELAPDRFLALFRGGERGSLAQSTSEDGGHTWSQEQATTIIGKPPHLLRLSDGALLCSYGHRADPWSIRAVLSYDEGKSWDTERLITIDQWEDRPDMGYPTSLEVEPNEILTVYYCSRQPLTHLPEQEMRQRKGASPEGILFKRFTLSPA